MYVGMLQHTKYNVCSPADDDIVCFTNFIYLLN